MCGINGFTSPKGVDEEQISKMNYAIRHRGPDDSGIFVDKNRTVGFGHQRLSIIDLSGGHQPLSNENDSLWIVFNGEIYNYKELGEDLEQRHIFKTKSDTEVILHLYEEKGEDCIKYLRGMFAFAIYDSEKSKLFLARDHLGQKPLYYYHSGEEFAFASEIKALLALKPELRQINQDALYEYLTIRIITPPRSMFSRINKLAPGHYLTFKKGALVVKRYWNLTFEPKTDSELPQLLTDLEGQIKSTLKYHLVSDVPVGAFLSGGLDSSLTLAMMSEFTEKPIKTFSGDLPYENYSEIPYARLMANKYKTDHHELKITPSIVRDLTDIVWHLDEPSDPLSICMYNLAKLTKKYVKVVVGGDGGDELFGGYDRYYGNILVDYYALIPEKLRHSILGKLINLTPGKFWYRSLSHRLQWMHQLSFHNGGNRYAKSLSYFYFSDQYKNRIYTEKFKKNVAGFDPERCLVEYFGCDNATDIIDKMLFVDSMTRMPDHPNMILDRMTMAHGLEARSPFLDHQLAEYCAKIPTRFKVKGTKLRYIQTELARKYLPKKMFSKKKQGFSSGLPYLLKDQYKVLSKVLLSDSRLVETGVIDNNEMQKLIKEHNDNKIDHGNRIWLLCNSEIWYRMYIENEDREALKASLKRASVNISQG